MNMENLIAAVDLGTTKIVCTVGKLINNRVKIIAYSEMPSKGIVRGRVENVKLAQLSLDPVIRDVENQIGKKIRKVFVGIAGQDIKCITPDAVTLQRENCEEMISQQEISKITDMMCKMQMDNGYNVLHAIPQSYNVDNYMSVSQPDGMIGNTITAQYKLLVGKENSKKLIENVLRSKNLELLDLVLEPVASAKAVLTEDDKEIGVALADIGGGTTDVIVIQNNIIRYAGIVPFGGNSVTTDICAGFGIAPKTAEQIKRNYGCCFSDYADANKTICIKGFGSGTDKEIEMKNLSKIIQARMEEILEAVCWHIDQSHYRTVLRGGLVLTGGGAMIKNIINLSNYITGFDTRTASPTSYTIDESSIMQAKTPAAATAVGMIVNAFDKMRDEGIIFSDSVADVATQEETAVPEMAGNSSASEEKKSGSRPWNRKRENKEGHKGRKGLGGLLDKITDGSTLFTNNYSDKA